MEDGIQSVLNFRYVLTKFSPGHLKWHGRCNASSLSSLRIRLKYKAYVQGPSSRLNARAQCSSSMLKLKLKAQAQGSSSRLKLKAQAQGSSSRLKLKPQTQGLSLRLMLKAQIQSSSRLKTENIFQNQELISEESWV